MTGRIAEDARDGSAHEKVWAKRGKVTTRLRNVVREIDTDVEVLPAEVVRDQQVGPAVLVVVRPGWRKARASVWEA